MNLGQIILESFQQDSVAWFIASILLGSVIGSSLKFVFEFLLESKIKTRWADKKLINELRFPFLRSCKALQKRIELMLKNNDTICVDDTNDNCFFLGTMYQFGVFFGWLKILEDKAFLEFSNNKQTSRFYRLFYNVMESFSGHIHFSKLTGVTYEEKCKGTLQRLVILAMGELMVRTNTTEPNLPTYRIIEFTEFSRLMNESEIYQKWFKYLANFLQNIKQDPSDLRWDRLAIIASFLSVICQYLDPQKIQSVSQITTYFEIIQNPGVIASLKISYEKLGMQKQLKNARKFKLN